MTDAKAGGRKSTYRPEYADIAAKLKLLGWKDYEIAQHMGVSKRTFEYWKSKHDDFRTAIETHKEIVDSNVLNATYQRAIGYEWEEEQAIKVRVSQFEERIEIVKVKKRVPPDTMACMYWMNNRQREHWRRNPEDANGGGDKPLSEQLSELSGKLPG